jgi:hypothetical protein
MSAIPPKADIAERGCHVRFVPKADIAQCSKFIVIRSSRSQRDQAARVGQSGYRYSPKADVHQRYKVVPERRSERHALRTESINQVPGCVV